MSKFSHISVDPGNITTAYAVSDQLGEVVLLSNAIVNRGLGSGPKGVSLKAVTIFDVSHQDADFDLFFFESSATGAADGTSAVFSDNELRNRLIGVVNFSGGLMVSAGGGSVGTLILANSLPLRGITDDSATAANLFCAMVIRTVVTYTATNALNVKFILQKE